MKYARKACALIIVFIQILCMLSAPAAADSASRPTLVLQSYEVSEKAVSGGSFELQYKILNTSAYSPANNILLTWSSQGNAIYPEEGLSNQQYVESVGAHGEYDGNMQFSVRKPLEAGIYPLTVYMRYQGPEDVSLTSEATLILTVHESGSVVINDILMAEECIVGRQIFISVKYENLGSEDLKNVRITLTGDIIGEEKTINIGSVRAMSTNEAEGYVTFQSEGETSLNVLMIYEDLAGNTATTADYSVRTTVRVQETAPVEPSPSPPAGNREILDMMTDSPTTILVMGASAAVILSVIVILAVRSRKRRR